MQSSTEGLIVPESAGRLEEPAWLAAARQGEPWALECMFRTYRQTVYALCFRLLSRADDAEDATQSTFVGAFRGVRRFQGNASIKTWLYRIAVNESLNILRHRGRTHARLSDDWPGPDRVPELVQKEAIASVLARMRPEQRTALVLFYWEDLNCEEIAAVMNVTLSAAKMRLKRAREEFQRRYGGEP